MNADDSPVDREWSPTKLEWEQAGLAVQQEPTPLSLIARMVESGTLTAESVAVVKELVALKEHMEDRQAMRDFAENLVGLQGELSTFVATKPVPDKNGNVKYCSLEYHEIMAKVQPLLPA